MELHVNPTTAFLLFLFHTSTFFKLPLMSFSGDSMAIIIKWDKDDHLHLQKLRSTDAVLTGIFVKHERGVK